MLSAPTLFALTGSALMAVVAFAPHRLPPPSATLSALVLPPPQPAWPTKLEFEAAYCDASVRLDIIDALRALDSAWACSVLRHALDDEFDDDVRTAIQSALSSSSQSLVT